MMVATFDLQSVLTVPCSKVSQFYYKRKLVCYNLTVYESATKEGFCFLWDETNGHRGSSEIGSCLLSYIKMLPNFVRHLVLFSDNCAGQNRNQFVPTLLLASVRLLEHLKVVEHKFLTKGHTQMECDSMHSAIEFAKREQSIYTVDCWAMVLRMARRKKPYKVNLMTFDLFYDLKDLASKVLFNRTKDDNGSTLNWLRIVALKFESAIPAKFFFKYEFDDEYTGVSYMPASHPHLLKWASLVPAYKKLLPISEAKNKDLISMCKAKNGQLPLIPKVYHGFYEELPSSKQQKNTAPEPSTVDSDYDEDE